MSCDVTGQRIKKERLGTSRLRATLMFNSPTKMIVVVGSATFPNTESLNLTKKIIDEAIANRQRSIHNKLGKAVEFSLSKVVDSRGFNSLYQISGWPHAWNSSAAVTGLDMKRLEKL